MLVTSVSLSAFASDIVIDVIKNLSFMACDADEILIKEGDRGDWYELLTLSRTMIL